MESLRETLQRREAYRQWREDRIRAQVAEAVAADIAARRSDDPLRRRFLDETMATASRFAILAAARP